MLRIEDLHVEVGGRKILRGVWLRVYEGEVHVIMGPNASGKTTLALTVLGHPAYKITRGRIIFLGRNISNLSVTERVKLGLGVAFQHPPAIRGVKLRDVLMVCAGGKPLGDLDYSKYDYFGDYLRDLGMDPKLYLDRDVNFGFSGGERKRVELVQLLVMKPRLMIFDEPDSGVDVDSLKHIGRKISELTKEVKGATIVITHYRHILPYVKPTVIHVLYNGRIVKSGNPDEVIEEIEEFGYEIYAKKLWM